MKQKSQKYHKITKIESQDGRVMTLKERENPCWESGGKHISKLGNITFCILAVWHLYFMHNSWSLWTDNHQSANIIIKDQKILHELLNSLKYKSYDGRKQELNELKTPLFQK